MEASKDLAPAIEGITDDEGDSIDGVIRSLRRSNLLMALLHHCNTGTCLHQGCHDCTVVHRLVVEHSGVVYLGVQEHATVHTIFDDFLKLLRESRTYKKLRSNFLCN